MRKTSPHIVVSLLLTLSSLVAMPSALAQQTVGDEIVTGVNSADTGMFASAARSISRSVGQWFGFNDEASSEPGSASGSDSQATNTPANTQAYGFSANNSSLVASNLMLEAFPALNSADDVLHSLDSNRERNFLDTSSGAPKELDLNASYIWESPRFGQFILSTNTTYVYNTSHTDVSRESAVTLAASDKSAAGFSLTSGLVPGLAPELQSSLTFTWQIGNHTATAVTSYMDGLESFGKLGNETLNIEQLNELMGEIATLDLSYGYNVKAGRQGNASISVGLRSQFDRRQLTPSISPANARMLNTPERMAYGTIKYQF